MQHWIYVVFITQSARVRPTVWPVQHVPAFVVLALRRCSAIGPRHCRFPLCLHCVRHELAERSVLLPFRPRLPDSMRQGERFEIRRQCASEVHLPPSFAVFWVIERTGDRDGRILRLVPTCQHDGSHTSCLNVKRLLLSRARLRFHCTLIFILQ